MNQSKLEGLFSLWKQRLGLDHWTIEIAIEKINPRTTTMRTTKSQHYNRGRIIVQPWVITSKPPADWYKSPDFNFNNVIEETVIHELLHLLLWETSSVIYLLSEFSKKSAHEIAIKVQENREENLVDCLATALVKSFGQKS